MPVYHALHALLTGVVQEVFKRHSEMSDPAMANVDQIVLVMSLNLPPFDARQATRFLVSAEAADIPVMLLLNKADLLEDDMTKALVAEVSNAFLDAISNHPEACEKDFTYLQSAYPAKCESAMMKSVIAMSKSTPSLSHCHAGHEHFSP